MAIGMLQELLFESGSADPTAPVTASSKSQRKAPAIDQIGRTAGAFASCPATPNPMSYFLTGPKAMVEAAGGVAEAFAVDIADENAVKAMVEAEVAAFGKLDFAVNGASIETKKGMIWEMPTKNFHEVLDIDLYGTFYCIREEAKQMVEQGHGGSIVNFSSGAATIGCYGMTPYACAKAGVNSVTKSAALDLGPHNVRVNAVLPGMTKTPMILAFKSHFPDMYDQMERQIPLGRLAEPEEQANVALFLCSELSSDITGELIEVDGGYLAGRYERVSE